MTTNKNSTRYYSSKQEEYVANLLGGKMEQQYKSKLLEDFEEILNKPLPTIYTEFWFRCRGGNIINVDKEEAESEVDRKHLVDCYFD